MVPILDIKTLGVLVALTITLLLAMSLTQTNPKPTMGVVDFLLGGRSPHRRSRSILYTAAIPAVGGALGALAQKSLGIAFPLGLVACAVAASYAVAPVFISGRLLAPPLRARIWHTRLVYSTLLMIYPAMGYLGDRSVLFLEGASPDRWDMVAVLISVGLNSWNMIANRRALEGLGGSASEPAKMARGEIATIVSTVVKEVLHDPQIRRDQLGLRVLAGLKGQMGEIQSILGIIRDRLDVLEAAGRTAIPSSYSWEAFDTRYGGPYEHGGVGGPAPTEGVDDNGETEAIGGNGGRERLVLRPGYLAEDYPGYFS